MFHRHDKVKQSLFDANYLIASCFLILLASGCGTGKYLQESEEILVKNRIVVEDENQIPDLARLKYELESLIEQKPNDRTLFFFKPRLWFYYRQQQRGDTTDFDKFVEGRLAEPPSLYDSSLAHRSADAMYQHLFNSGYLTAEVRFSDVVKNKKAYVTYHVKPNQLFTIESFEISAPDSLVNDILVKHADQSFLQPGEPVSNALLYREKQRVITDLHRRGFANFTQANFSQLEATDTADATVKMQLRLLPGTSGTFNQKYIGSVLVNNRFPGWNFTKPTPEVLDQIHFYNFGTKNKIRPDALLDYIKLRPGKLFIKEDLTATRSQLQLPAIRYADIRSKPREDNPDIIDFEIDVLASRRYETDLEFQINRTIVGSDPFIGLGANASLVNNNFLGGSERFSNSLDINFEVDPQFRSIFNAANFKFSNTLEIPRYSDYLGIYKRINQFNWLSDEAFDRIRTNGTTIIDLTYEYVELFDYFKYHSLTANYGHRSTLNTSSTRRRIQVIHPSITYFSSTLKQQFLGQYGEESFARKSFEPYLLTSLFFNRINYTLEQLQGIGGYTSAFLGSFELSGTEVYLADLIFNNTDKPFSIGDLKFAQFAKLELDGRLYKQLNSQQALAFRTNIGIGTPFGNAEVIPFVKQFYLGGPLSMRAWRIRELGPGSYQGLEVSREDNSAFFQTGDIKILLNAEYRFDIFWRIEGAMFLDAGNIWTLKSDEREGAKFSKRFLDQMALGTGAGMRFDADYFKIIFDVGLKMRNPFPDDSGSHYALRNTQPLNDVINLNFAINYPF